MLEQPEELQGLGSAFLLETGPAFPSTGAFLGCEEHAESCESVGNSAKSSSYPLQHHPKKKITWSKAKAFPTTASFPLLPTVFFSFREAAHRAPGFNWLLLPPYSNHSISPSSQKQPKAFPKLCILLKSQKKWSPSHFS